MHSGKSAAINHPAHATDERLIAGKYAVFENLLQLDVCKPGLRRFNHVREDVTGYICILRHIHRV